MLNRIIQWNCRGLKVNYEETLLLLKDYEPAALCLQETLFENKPNMIPSFGIRIFSEFENMNLDLDTIADFKISDGTP